MKTKQTNTNDKKEKKDDTIYPENGQNFKAGKEETGTLPNDPAENATKTSPEEDAKKKKEKPGK